MTEENKCRYIYVVGDNHGHYDALVQIIEQIIDDGFDKEQDMLIQLGDIIDGGSKVKECVDFWRQMCALDPNSSGVLLGNHESLLLNAIGKHEGQSDFRVWWYQGGRATHLSYDPDFDETKALFLMGAHGLPSEGYTPPPNLQHDIAWLKTLPHYYETDSLIVVHAGLRPPLPPEANTKRDMLWIREEFFNSGYDWPKTIVYGHTAREDFAIIGKTIGIDLGYRRRGRIGAAKLQDGQLIKTFVGDS